MTPEQRQRIETALQCDALPKKDRDFLSGLLNSGDEWQPTPAQAKWMSDAIRRAERLKGAA